MWTRPAPRPNIRTNTLTPSTARRARTRSSPVAVPTASGRPAATTRSSPGMAMISSSVVPVTTASRAAPAATSSGAVSRSSVVDEFLRDDPTFFTLPMDLSAAEDAHPTGFSAPSIVPASLAGLSVEGNYADGKDVLLGGADTDWLFGGGDQDQLDGGDETEYADGVLLRGRLHRWWRGERRGARRCRQTTWFAAAPTTTSSTATAASTNSTATAGADHLFADAGDRRRGNPPPARPAALGWRRLSTTFGPTPQRSTMRPKRSCRAMSSMADRAATGSTATCARRS